MGDGGPSAVDEPFADEVAEDAAGAAVGDAGGDGGPHGAGAGSDVARVRRDGCLFLGVCRGGAGGGGVMCAVCLGRNCEVAVARRFFWRLAPLRL